MTTPLVSIILPTYNVAPYLLRCLESITAQTYKELEIIVVIDGATDGSYEIAQQYKNVDDRCKVIYQVNAGSGPARNNGLNNAKGKFIAFVDPDDWIKPDYIEKLVAAQQLNDSDLVLSGYETHLFIDGEDNNRGTNTFKVEKILQTQNDVRNHYLELRCNIRLINAPWAKLYKASLIKEHGIIFPDLRRSQDIYFNTEYFNYISSLTEIRYVGYCYRVLQGERIKKINKDYYNTTEILFKQVVNMLEDWSIEYDKTLLYNTFYLNLLICFEYNISNKIDVSYLFESEFVNDILRQANPTNYYHKVLRILILNRSWILFRIALWIKKNIKK